MKIDIPYRFPAIARRARNLHRHLATSCPGVTCFAMKMAKISILIAFLPYLLCAMAKRQPYPCSEYFRYMTKPGITDMLGQIEIPSPSENDTFYLKVALDTTTERPVCETIFNVAKYPQKQVRTTHLPRFEIDDLKNGKVIRLELAQSIKVSVGRVHQGKSLLYHVYYPIHEPIPSLTAIWFNNQRYCPGPEVSGNITANVELGHILYPPNEEPLVYYDGPWKQIAQPWHRNISQYCTDNPSYDRINNDECGITSYYTDDTNRLIPDLEMTLPGQWPWLVAIHIVKEDTYFKGSGSILTTRHIIAALQDVLVDNIDNVYVSFGQLKSSNWHENHTGVVHRGVAEYKIPPYTKNPKLMILILKTAVEFNAFISPICLWSGSNNLQDIVNMTGYIAGWGYEGFKCPLDRHCSGHHGPSQSYTEEPRTVKVSLMNIFERTNADIYKALVISTEHLKLNPFKSFDNPCDLGAGLMIFNITTGRYQLRGVASHCHPFISEIPFINVANYLSWIREQISII